MNSILPEILASRPHLSVYDQASRFNSIDISAILVYIVDTVQSDILELLAEQFDVLGFKGMDNAATDKDKRQLIKNAIALKKHIGTPWAIEEAIKVFGYDPEIIENIDHWADFAVVIPVEGREMTAKETERLLRLINYYKNARSHLKSLVYKKAFTEGVSLEDQFIYPEYSNMNDGLVVSGTVFHNGTVRRNGQWVYNNDTDILSISINNS